MSKPSTTTSRPPETAEELREHAADRTSYLSVIDRLNKASVDRHWEAYADVPWDDPDCAIDPDDPRWILPPDDRLGSTAWYHAQPPEVRARIGLWRIATFMKVGMQFENLLQRGLLTYAYGLPNERAEFRYALHETAEECHHSMMFQEFVNRTGLPIKGMPRALSAVAQTVPLMPRLSTELFFFFVLGGEDPIDHLQRKALKSGHIKHPLEEAITRIHIAEEARHISFARHYLRHRVPRLGAVRRTALGLAAPLILRRTARIMLAPPRDMIRHFGIPRGVVREAYRGEPAHAEMRDALRKVRELSTELGLVTPAGRRIWSMLGIWDRPAPASGRAEGATGQAGGAIERADRP